MARDSRNLRAVAEILDNVDIGRAPTEMKLIIPDRKRSTPWFARTLSGEQLFADPGPQPELFEGLIPAECVMLLGGPGGVGKTTLAMMMAICLITGRRLFGQFQPATSGHVILYMGEDGDASSRRIFRRIEKAMKLTLDEQQEVRRFLHLGPLVGIPGKLTRTLGNGRLEIAPDVQEFCDNSKSRFDSLAAVIFDPILRFHAGEESTNEHGDVLIQAANQIVLRLNTSVMLTAHTTKESRNVGVNHNPGTAFRGASSLYDGARHAILLSPKKERVVLTTAKCNLSQPPSPLELERGVAGFLRIARAPDDKEALLESLSEQVVDKLESEIAAGRMYTKNKFVTRFFGSAGPFSASKHMLDRAILRALENKILIHDDKKQLLVSRAPVPGPGAQSREGERFVAKTKP